MFTQRRVAHAAVMPDHHGAKIIVVGSSAESEALSTAQVSPGCVTTMAPTRVTGVLYVWRVLPILQEG